MGRKLSITVYVTGEDGRPKALLPGSEPSAAEAEGITNPDVWQDDGDEAAVPQKAEPTGRTSRKG